MKCLAAVLILAAVASASQLDTFREWAKTHGKVYTTSEQARRFAIFKENAAIAERLNLENHGATFGLTKFADLTNAEFKAVATTNLAIRQKSHPAASTPDSNADEKDWTELLPPVKDQASCGSCWAFSAVANMEGVWAKESGKTTALSEQQLVSCDKQDSGCNGGWMTTADDWVMNVNGGITTQKDYPYTSGGGSTGSCKTGKKSVVTFKNVHDLGETTDQKMIDAIDQYGPLSVAIEADRSVFQLYSGGILDSTGCGTTLDHGVTLVGYGTDGGKKFWKVRNSWGQNWGEEGYIRMIRNKNMCGINSAVSSVSGAEEL